MTICLLYTQQQNIKVIYNHNLIVIFTKIFLFNTIFKKK